MYLYCLRGITICLKTTKEERREVEGRRKRDEEGMEGGRVKSWNAPLDQRALGFNAITAPCHLVTVSYLQSQTELRLAPIYKMEYHSSVQWPVVDLRSWSPRCLTQRRSPAMNSGPVSLLPSSFLHPPFGMGCSHLRLAAGNIQRDEDEIFHLFQI